MEDRLAQHLEKEEEFQRELLVSLERLQARADRADEVHQALLEQIKTLSDHLHSTEAGRPGLSMRIDRIEQERIWTKNSLRFITGGSLVTSLGLIILVIKMVFKQ